MKKLFNCLSLILLLYTVSSCEKAEESEKSPNAQIASFSISSKDYPEIRNYSFVIDQINSLLFNKEPLPDEIKINTAELHISTIENVSSIEIVTDTETTPWKKGTIISLTQNTTVVITAEDGIHTKHYKLILRSNSILE